MTLTADQIPDEVVEAAAKHISEADMEDYPNYWKKQLRASIAAALNVWPGAQEKPYWEFRTHERHSELILPLPRKPQP